MTVFDLLFVLIFLTTVVMLALAAMAAGQARWPRAIRIVRGLAILVAVYVAVVIVVSLVSSPRELAVGDRRCFDDWCIAIEQVDQRDDDIMVSCKVTFRLSSRARRRPQRETGVSVYVVDDQGRRFAPVPDSGDASFDVMLQPRESVSFTRTFTLPPDAGNLGLVVAHGRFPGMFIIGDDQSLFHHPAVVRF